ncbi:response regulator [Actinoplanes sp. NPDC026619]|uniref:response regulator transcription factor n=1 Tax=Actinoplanes sp. NPDC026619 TaxID=3155798 RepID=UPI0033E6DDED
MAMVLIVDDDEAVLGLIAATLAVAGIDSRTATSGTEALNSIATVLPDCVVLDIMMPGPSGLDLCSMLRADDLTDGIPVILLTARGQHADRASGFDCGADDYIIKPFDPADLNRRVIALLSPVRQQRWRRQDSVPLPAASLTPTLTLGCGPAPR